MLIMGEKGLYQMQTGNNKISLRIPRHEYIFKYVYYIYPDYSNKQAYWSSIEGAHTCPSDNLG